MKILITGGNGLLGYEVSRKLQDNHFLVSLTREISTRKEGKIEYLTCDLAADFAIDKLPSDVEAIVHLAQSPHYREFPHNVEHVFKVNCASTAKLLEYAAKIKVKHFIYTSTGSVYEPYSCEMKESSPTSPASFYANSKLIAERLFAPYKGYFNISILRLFFLYGPHPLNKQTVINNLWQRLRENQEITIDGEEGGLCFVPTLTTDVANCIAHILQKEITGTINIANPKALTIEEIVHIMADHLQVIPKITRFPKKCALTIIPNLETMHTLLPEMQFSSFSSGMRQLIDTVF